MFINSSVETPDPFKNNLIPKQKYSEKQHKSDVKKNYSPLEIHINTRRRKEVMSFFTFLRLLGHHLVTDFYGNVSYESQLSKAKDTI